MILLNWAFLNPVAPPITTRTPIFFFDSFVAMFFLIFTRIEVAANAANQYASLWYIGAHFRFMVTDLPTFSTKNVVLYFVAVLFRFTTENRIDVAANGAIH